MNTPARLDQAIAVSDKDHQQFGCPNCGYRSGRTPLSLGGAALWHCGSCYYSCAVLAEGVTVSPIQFGKDGIKPVLQDHPRRGIPAHGRPDTKPENGGEFFRSRGLGLDSTPGCMVCGGSGVFFHNIAAFVQCKEAGERVVAMFNGQGARLDYRDFEPDRVQVKVGACNKHRENLQRLDELTRVDGVITAEMIAQVCSS